MQRRRMLLKLSHVWHAALACCSLILVLQLSSLLRTLRNTSQLRSVFLSSTDRDFCARITTIHNCDGVLLCSLFFSLKNAGNVRVRTVYFIFFLGGLPCHTDCCEESDSCVRVQCIYDSTSFQRYTFAATFLWLTAPSLTRSVLTPCEPIKYALHINRATDSKMRF